MSRIRPYSAPDPGQFFNEWDVTSRNTFFNEQVSLTPRTLSVVATTLFLFITGQSLVTSIISDTFTPTNGSAIDCYTWYDGKNYVGVNPLKGCGGANHNYNLKIADGLITNGKFQKVVLIPCAISGTNIEPWASDGLGGTQPSGYCRAIISAAKRLAAQGITPSTPNAKFLIKWNQGESDTRDGISQAAYTASFNKMKARVDVDFPVKWMVAKETHYIGVNSSAIQAAQAAVVNGTTVFVGEDMDSIADANRIGDQTHLTAAGGNLAATMGINAITAITF